MVKAKATKFCPRGVLEVEASPPGPPYLGFFTARRYEESGYAKSSVCPSLSTRLPPLVRLCMKYFIYGIDY